MMRARAFAVCWRRPTDLEGSKESDGGPLESRGSRPAFHAHVSRLPRGRPTRGGLRFRQEFMTKNLWLLVVGSVLFGSGPGLADDARQHPARVYRPSSNSRAGIAAASSSGSGVSSGFGIPHGVPSDTRFVTEGLDTGCRRYTDGPIEIDIAISRSIGDVDSDGLLEIPATLVANGVVSRFATLRMPVWDVDAEGDPNDSFAPPERDRVTVNGQNIGPFVGEAIGGARTPVYLTGANNTWSMFERKIPISLLKFGTRTAGNPIPTPGVNRIRIDIDELHGGWCTSADWAELKFEALAPVIMFMAIQATGVSSAPET